MPAREVVNSSMRFIIDFSDTTPATAIRKYFEANSCEIVELLDQLGLTYIVEAPARPKTSKHVEYIIDDQNGISLLGDVEFKVASTEDEDNWWKLAVVQHVDYDQEEFKLVRAGYGWNVYVMDSGIKLDHPEFAGKSVNLLHSLTGEFSDTTGHGTALASVIIGETCGITEATLNIVKVFHQDQTTYLSDLLTALQKIAEHVDPTRPSVLNMSWAIPKNEFIEAKLMALINKGVICVAAAGNDGTPIQDVTPASMEQVITVGAFGQDLKPCDFTNYTGPSATSYTEGPTNVGPALDMFAPGEHIRVGTTDGAHGYSIGTSIAAAITSACVVIQQSRLNSDYQDYDQAVTFEVYQKTFVSRGLLDLEGVYEGSINAIPRAGAKFHEDVDKTAFNSRTAVLLENGTPIRIRTFDPTVYTEAEVATNALGLVLEGNWLVGAIAPTVETSEQYTVTVTARNDRMEHTVTYTIGVYNPDAYPSTDEAYIDSGIALLAPCCGCGGCGYIICCECDDPKNINCNECAHICN